MDIGRGTLGVLMDTGIGALGHGHWKMDTGRGALGHGLWNRGTRAQTIVRD